MLSLGKTGGIALGLSAAALSLASAYGNDCLPASTHEKPQTVAGILPGVSTGTAVAMAMPISFVGMTSADRVGIAAANLAYIRERGQLQQTLLKLNELATRLDCLYKDIQASVDNLAILRSSDEYQRENKLVQEKLVIYSADLSAYTTLETNLAGIIDQYDQAYDGYISVLRAGASIDDDDRNPDVLRLKSDYRRMGEAINATKTVDQFPPIMF